MRRLFELKCGSCGAVVEEFTSLEEVPETPCPLCGKKSLKRKYSTFSSGGSCGIKAPGRQTG